MKDFQIQITEEAAVQLREMLQSNNQEVDDVYLRLAVVGGGCSGLQYGLYIDGDLPEAEDILSMHNGIQIVVDEMSANYVNGSIIEWDNGVFGGGFKVNNPNVTNSCGCGSSFQTGDKDGPSGGCGSCGCSR